MDISLFQNEKNIFINNIFKIRKNIFEISNFNELNNRIRKKISFNKIVEVILIPSRQEIIEQDLKYKIWYSIDELNSMRKSYMCEINIISNINYISLSEAIKLWKESNTIIYSSS